jgi:hypothetical protein
MPLDPKENTRRILAEYRQQMKRSKPSPEQMSEMRAAFGAGTVVVNVITGKRTKL